MAATGERRRRSVLPETHASRHQSPCCLSQLIRTEEQLHKSSYTNTSLPLQNSFLSNKLKTAAMSFTRKATLIVYLRDLGPQGSPEV